MEEVLHEQTALTETVGIIRKTGGVTLEEVIAAYFDCRKNKRNTANALLFEEHYEEECGKLTEEINNGTYRPGRSITFIVTRPVVREIFAADFRDRVVHHLIAMKIAEKIDRMFIEDSYSTRKGKGTLYGIKRVQQMIVRASENYTRPCLVMKLDISGFFMAIDKKILYELIETRVIQIYHGEDIELLLRLIKVVVYNRPECNCIRKSPQYMWMKLPRKKSLLFTNGTHGLPIGNLTSQLFALLFLDDLDHYVTEELTKRFPELEYGRYVDDMVFVYPGDNKEAMKTIRKEVERWLRNRRQKLHPDKFFLQQATHGVLFVGGMIKPGRLYTAKRTFGNIYNAVRKYNCIINETDTIDADTAESFMSTLNSYFGLLKQTASYNICQKIIHMIDRRWFRIMYITHKGRQFKVVLKKPYKRNRMNMAQEQRDVASIGTGTMPWEEQ